MGFSMILKLFGGVKNFAVAIVVALALAAGGLWVLKQKHALTKAQKDLVTVTQQRDDAARARDDAINVSKANVETIKKLQQEKQDALDAIEQQNERSKRDTATILAMGTALSAQANNPANKVELSPVLKQVLTSIQAERNKRAGGLK